jgi:hypothetical protein
VKFYRSQICFPSFHVAAEFQHVHTALDFPLMWFTSFDILFIVVFIVIVAAAQMTYRPTFSFLKKIVFPFQIYTEHISRILF